MAACAGGWEGKRTPDFDALVVGTRHDGLAARREAHGVHRAAVRVLFLGDQSQGRGICKRGGGCQLMVGYAGAGKARAPQTLMVPGFNWHVHTSRWLDALLMPGDCVAPPLLHPVDFPRSFCLDLFVKLLRPEAFVS